MTAQDFVALLGRTGTIRLNDLSLKVKVKDVKEVWGKVRYLVTPLAGAGEQWMENVDLDPVGGA